MTTLSRAATCAIAIFLFSFAAECRGSGGVATPPAGERAPQDALALVERFREGIAIADAAARQRDAAEAERLRSIGRLLFHRQLQLRRALSERLVVALATPTGDELARTLDYLESDPRLHDADKLAFRELVDDLADAAASLPDGAPKAALAKRLGDDARALAEINGRYQAEMQKVVAALGTRAIVPSREAWESYLSFVRAGYPSARIAQDYAHEFAAGSDARGGGPSESAIETFGRGLPPKTVLLTFDDGPHPRYTDKVLAILARYGLSGVFFEVGQNIGSVDADGKVKTNKGADISRRIEAQGSTLANHSFSHANLPKLDDRALDAEIDHTEALLREVDPKVPPLFRPPYGARTNHILTLLGEKNLRSIQWNIDSEDWADPVAASVAQRVIDETERQGRGIILFHDIHDRAIDALPTVIDTLAERGYRFARWNGSDFEVPPDDATLIANRSAGEAAAAPRAVAAYRESWAVVIGIDDYAHWPKLSYAARDADGVAQLLIGKYGFKADHVLRLADGEATRERILTLLGDTLADPKKVARDDRVLVFYAGHGATRHLASGRDLGYLVPVDADLANLQGTAISMSNLQDVAEAIPAKHVLFVMDSCYSGLALTRGGGNGNFLAEISRRPARQMLTAGGADQQVADGGPNGHSIFTWTLLRALGGEGDLNGDGVITATELAAFAGPIVSSLSRQTPAFGALPGSEGGEFFFELAPEETGAGELGSRLDADAGKLGDELAQLKQQIAAKSQRNNALAEQLAKARAQLAALDRGGDTGSRSVGTVQAAIDHNEKGNALYREKDYAAALTEFLAATSLDPNYALAANNVGFMYFRLGQLDDAVAWYRRTLTIDVGRAVAWLNLADAELARGKRPEARAAYARFLELNPAAKAADYARGKLAELDAAP